MHTDYSPFFVYLEAIGWCVGYLWFVDVCVAGVDAWWLVSGLAWLWREVARVSASVAMVVMDWFRLFNHFVKAAHIRLLLQRATFPVPTGLCVRSG